MEITLKESKNLVDDIWEFQFTRPKPLQFDAGDYVEVGLGQAGRRWLTIASPPGDDQLTFITKLSSKRSSFKQALSELKPGATATISPAIGNFNLPPTDDRPLLWVAGGIGITPYLSMLRWLETHPQRKPDINLLYAARPDQHIYLDKVEASQATVHQQTQRTTLDDILRLAADTHPLIYLSGPEPLCKQLWQQLLDSGVKRADIKLDYFEGYENI